MMSDRVKLIAVPIVLAVLAAAPLALGTGYWLGLATTTLMFALLAQAWNLLGGYGGQFSFGHALFFGTGGYVTAVLQVRLGVDPWTGLVAGTAAGAAVGAFCGALSFRYGLKGSYFALVTLAFAEVFRILATSVPFTGGGAGILIPLKVSAGNFQFADKAGFYYAVLILFAISLLVTLAVERSRFGAYLVAVRENEAAAAALGINIFRVKLGAITLSGALAALAGVFYTQFYLYLDPHIAYGAGISVEALLAPIIGGLGTLFGPLIGAIVMRVLGELAHGWTGGAPGLSLALFGLLLIIVLRFLPDGIVGLIARLGRRRHA